eukprot:4589108-Amphidinium_carterae.1
MFHPSVFPLCPTATHRCARGREQLQAHQTEGEASQGPVTLGEPPAALSHARMATRMPHISTPHPSKVGVQRSGLSTCIIDARIVVPVRLSLRWCAHSRVAKDAQKRSMQLLPEGWVRMQSKSKPGVFFYAHPATGRTQMKSPPQFT